MGGGGVEEEGNVELPPVRKIPGIMSTCPSCGVCLALLLQDVTCVSPDDVLYCFFFSLGGGGGGTASSFIPLVVKEETGWSNI